MQKHSNKLLKETFIFNKIKNYQKKTKNTLIKTKRANSNESALFP